MAEEKYALFINKIIDDTKKSSIVWKYLDTEKNLTSKMGWYNALGFDDTYLFDREDSFYTFIDLHYIVLFTKSGDTSDIYIIPETYKKIVKIPSEYYGEAITRLLNLVQSKFPNAENFISNYIDK